MTNYATDKPAFAFSTSTTEFDDALIERDIVTLEQAFMAKGASAEEAQRLAALKRNEQDAVGNDGVQFEKNKNNTESDDGSESDKEDDDDEFLEQYRRQRLEQLKKKAKGSFGEVIPISRSDWTREVNDASNKSWVVVTLTSHDVERTWCIEEAVNKLATNFPSIKFFTIPSNAAIADWPSDNLPTVFLYRNGNLQKELIRLKGTITADELEWDLAECGVLETELEYASAVDREEVYCGARNYSGLSVFGGSLAQLETRRNESDEDDSDGT